MTTIWYWVLQFRENKSWSKRCWSVRKNASLQNISIAGIDTICKEMTNDTINIRYHFNAFS